MTRHLLLLALTVTALGACKRTERHTARTDAVPISQQSGIEAAQALIPELVLGELPAQATAVPVKRHPEDAIATRTVAAGTHALLYDAAHWYRFWTAVRPGRPVPAVDFTRTAILAVRHPNRGKALEPWAVSLAGRTHVYLDQKRVTDVAHDSLSVLTLYEIPTAGSPVYSVGLARHTAAEVANAKPSRTARLPS